MRVDEVSTVDRYEVEWTVKNLLDALREGYDSRYNLYFLLAEFKEKEKVVYIESVNKQTVSERLLNKHKGLKSAILDYDGDEIYIGLGEVLRKRVKTKEMIEGIETALISYEKPDLNAVGVKTYEGPAITIINSQSDDSDYGVDLEEEIEFD